MFYDNDRRARALEKENGPYKRFTYKTIIFFVFALLSILLGILRILGYL